jgi:cation:H+ antiporter
MESGIAATAALAGGIALIIVGAEAFFDGLLAVARRIGVSTFFLTVLISGLEIENIAAGMAANLAGFPGAAAGTFLGGTTFIALGISGLGAILVPFRVTLPRAFLLATFFAGVPLLLLAHDRELSRLDGVILMATFGAIMTLLHYAAGDRRAIDDAVMETEQKRLPFVWLVGGLALMTAGGELLGNGIQAVVSRFGISATLLGNTAIAAITEAEEIGRVAVPARRGRPDVGVANVGGTAIHFLTLNAGILAVVHPLRLDESTMRLHLPIAVAAPAIFCLTLGVSGGLDRIHGLLLISLYVAYIGAAMIGVAPVAR